MGKKEKLHKRCHNLRRRKITWILVSQNPDVSLARPGPKARPDSSDSFSTEALIMNISNIAIVSGMVLSILDLTLVQKGHVKKNKRIKRSETTTADSKSEVHVDTEIDTAVDSDNEPTPNLCHIEVEIENKTNSSNTVDLKLPGSTGKKKMKKRTKKCDQRENKKSLSELWPKPSKYYEKINTEKESNSASLSKNILIDFKSKKFPFILSTNVFQEFLSTIGNKLNLRDFNFSYRYPVLEKDFDIIINSQVTFTTFINYILSENTNLTLLKITQVNSQPLMILKEEELSPPKSDDKTIQPQSSHLLTINWILKMPVAKRF